MERKTEYTLKELISVAKELNKRIGGLSPKIDVRDRLVEELELDLQKVSVEIVEPSDKFTPFTTKVVKALGGKPRRNRKERPDSKPIEKKPKRTRYGDIDELIQYLAPMVAKGKWTRKQLLAMAKSKFRGRLTPGTIHNIFSRGVTGHPQSKFKKIIKVDPITKIASF